MQFGSRNKTPNLDTPYVMILHSVKNELLFSKSEGSFINDLHIF